MPADPTRPSTLGQARRVGESAAVLVAVVVAKVTVPLVQHLRHGHQSDLLVQHAAAMKVPPAVIFWLQQTR
jgi:hypothetical protein